MKKLKQNLAVRLYAKSKDVYMFEIARELGLSLEYFSRKMRYEMADEEQVRLVVIIDKIAERHETEFADFDVDAKIAELYALAKGDDSNANS